MDISSIKYGDWRVVRKLGSGTFGAVYEIEKNDYGTFKAALKVITIPRSENETKELIEAGMNEESVRKYYEDEIEKLVREFALMSKLKGNSNIVSYEDHKVIEHKDDLGWDIYIRMELLTPMDEYCHKHGVSRQDVIRLGIDICKALEQCQKIGVIHRDIKPANIMVSNLGNYKLGDFGIARSTDRTLSTLTQGQGTDGYMAPEVYKGQKYGSSVDIYSLGIVMYRMLNRNRRPFFPKYPAPITYTDQINAKIRRMAGEPIPMPSEDQTRLAEIVLKACAYDPNDRYSSPRAMRQDLEAIQYTIEDQAVFGEKETMLDSPTASSVSRSATKDVQIYTRDEYSALNDGSPLEETCATELLIDVPYTGNKTKAEPKPVEIPKAEPEPVEIPKAEPKPKEQTSDQNSSSYEGSKDTEKKKKKLVPIIVLILCLVGAGIGFYLSSTVAVPGVEGMTYQEAETTLKQAGFSCKEGESENSDIIAKDHVIKTEESGRVSKNDTITLILSRGKSIQIPNVVGESADEIKKELSDAGLIVEVEGVYSDKVEKGIIISQEIAEGTLLNEGDTFIITQSLGMEMVKVKDYTNMTLDQATAAAEKAGFVVKTEQKHSTKIKKGSVISQDLAKGSQAAKGSTIVLTVSKGPEQVKVPNIVGKSKSDAIKALESAGLKASTSSEYSSSVSSGNVIWQGKEAGKTIDKGSTVTIGISMGRKPVSTTKKTTKKKSSKKKRGGSAADFEWN